MLRIIIKVFFAVICLSSISAFSQSSVKEIPEETNLLQQKLSDYPYKHEYKDLERVFTLYHGGIEEGSALNWMADFLESASPQLSQQEVYGEEFYYTGERTGSKKMFSYIIANIELHNWDVLRGLRSALSNESFVEKNLNKHEFVLCNGIDHFVYANDELLYLPRFGNTVRFKEFSQPRLYQVRDPRPPFSGAEMYYTWESFPVLDNELGSAKSIETMTQQYYSSGKGFSKSLSVVDQWNYSLQRESYYSLWQTSATPLDRLEHASGYKIFHVKPDHGSEILIRGEIAPQETQFELQPGTDNWVGYWLLNSQHITDALGSLIDDVEYVLSRDWFYNTNSYHTPYWRMDFGQMYIIRLKDRVNKPVIFQWNNSYKPEEQGAPPRESVSRNSYVHQIQYQVIDIANVENVGEIDEIGIFVNDTCIGAATVDSFPVQILIYPFGWEGLDLQFRFYQGSDSVSVSNHRTEILNVDTGEFRSETPKAGNRFYTTVRLLDNTAKSPDSNPFAAHIEHNRTNHSVHISLSLPEMRDLEITLYNIRVSRSNSLPKVNMKLVTIVSAGMVPTITVSRSRVVSISVASKQEARL